MNQRCKLCHMSQYRRVVSASDCRVRGPRFEVGGVAKWSRLYHWVVRRRSSWVVVVATRIRPRAVLSAAKISVTLTGQCNESSSRVVAITTSRELAHRGIEQCPSPDICPLPPPSSPIKSHGFESRPFRFRVTTLGKLFTHICLRFNTYGRRAFSVAGPMAWNSLPFLCLPKP